MDTLRDATAAKLYLYADLYCRHPNFNTVLKHPDANLSCKSYESISLTDEGIQVYDATNDFRHAIQTVEVETCLKRSWSAMIHMFALTSVIGRDIHSVYPVTNKAIRPFYHYEIIPMGNLEHKQSLPLYLMWSRNGNLDNRHGSLFEPNHFVPLLKRNVTYDGFDKFPQTTLKDEPGNEPTAPIQSQDIEQQTTDGTSPEGGATEPAQSQDKVQQSIHGTSPERGAREPAQSQDKVQQSIDGTSPERRATEPAQSQDKVQQTIDGTSPERRATEPAQSQDKVQQTIDGTSPERGATKPAQSQDKVQQTIDGTSPERGAAEPAQSKDKV